MISEKIYRVTVMLFVSVGLISQVMASDILTNPRYSNLKNEFLNINPNLFFEIDIAGMTSQERDALIQGPSAGSPLKLEEVVSPGNLEISQFGVPHSCKNSFDDDAVCWYATGGSIGDFHEGVCGEPIEGGGLASAVSSDSKHCSAPDVDWAGIRYWFGTNTRNEYVVDQFPGASGNPANRICSEITFPDQDKLFFDHTNPKLSAKGTDNLDTKPELSQLVNPSTAAPNLRDIIYEWGTYVSPIANNDGTTVDPEAGGTYQSGGSHFYHKFTAYDSVPTDRIYAVNSNTLVLCIGNNPSGVRSGMRPNYISNPLLTLGGEDDNGFTTAPSYMNYLTRLYFDFPRYSARINYPFNITLNKLWIMYEENDIFLASRGGGTLGVDVVFDKEPAIYPITLFNNANTDRTYRLFMSSGEKLVRRTDSDDFQLFKDLNKNKILDGNEIASLIPANTTLTLPADTLGHYILVHTPDFKNAFALERYGRKFLQGTLSFIEVGRLRSASYAVRTWEANTKDDIDNKAQWIADTQYPNDEFDAMSYWNRYREFNQDKDIATNPKLVRNSPDFKIIFKLTPKPPTSLFISQ